MSPCTFIISLILSSKIPLPPIARTWGLTGAYGYRTYKDDIFLENAISMWEIATPWTITRANANQKSHPLKSSAQFLSRCGNCEWGLPALYCVVLLTHFNFIVTVEGGIFWVCMQRAFMINDLTFKLTMGDPYNTSDTDSIVGSGAQGFLILHPLETGFESNYISQSLHSVRASMHRQNMWEAQSIPGFQHISTNSPEMRPIETQLAQRNVSFTAIW